MTSPWHPKGTVGVSDPHLPEVDDQTFTQLEIAEKFEELLKALPDGSCRVATALLAVETQIGQWLMNEVAPEGRTKEGVHKVLSALSDVTIKIRTDVMGRLSLERSSEIPFRVLEILSLVNELNHDQEDNIPSILFSCFATSYVTAIAERPASEKDLREALDIAISQFKNEVDRAFVRKRK